MLIAVNLRLKALINVASSQVSLPVASPLRRGTKEKIPDRQENAKKVKLAFQN
jgi:hypothetical protein